MTNQITDTNMTALEAMAFHFFEQNGKVATFSSLIDLAKKAFPQIGDQEDAILAYFDAQKPIIEREFQSQVTADELRLILSAQYG